MSAVSISPATLPVPSERPAINPWLIAVTVTLATFMELLDTAIANVSLPHIAGGLAAGLDESTWVLTSYLVANAVVLPLSAWLSRVFGRKNYYLGCVAAFTVASFLCGTAPSLGWLIFFRVLQGIAGGGLAPCEQAILVDTFPPAKRAGAFALYSIAIVLAPAIGPTLGGWITDSYSWRWVFFINVPVGILSIFLTSQLVQDPPEFTRERVAMRASGKLSADYLGIGLTAVGFGCLEVMLDKGQREDWFESRFIVAFAVIGIGALCLLVWWELRCPEPIVELRLLGERNFALACVFYFLFGFVLFGSTLLVPQMLQSLFGYDATTAGQAMTPGALVIVCMVPIVLRLIPYFGAARLLCVGFVIMGFAMWRTAQLDLTATFANVVKARMLFGLGLSFLFVPTSQLAYSYLPKNKNNKASSLTNLFRNQGGSFGIALATTWLDRRTQFHHSILAERISAYNPLYTARLHAMQSMPTLGDHPAPGTASRALAALAQTVDQQAALLAFLDCFLVLVVPTVLAALLTFVIKRWNPAPPPAGEAAH